jgi:hypothetical protein
VIFPSTSAVGPEGKTSFTGISKTFPAGRITYPGGKTIFPSGPASFPKSSIVGPWGKKALLSGRTTFPLGKMSRERGSEEGESSVKTGGRCVEIQKAGPGAEASFVPSGISTVPVFYGTYTKEV